MTDPAIADHAFHAFMMIGIDQLRQPMSGSTTGMRHQDQGTREKHIAEGDHNR